MKVFLFLISLSFLTPFNSNPKIIEIELPEVLIKSEHCLKSKWCLFRDLGRSLPLTITPERFANSCIVTFWSESNLKTSAKGGDQQGFFQLTSNTRRKLGIPDSILATEMEKQVSYLKTYLLSTKKSHLIKGSIELHELNFAPSNFGKRVLSGTKGNLKYLDKNKDGIVTREDLKLFQQKRIQSSEFVKQCYSQMYPTIN